MESILTGMQTLRDIAHKRIRSGEEKKEGLGTFTGVFLPSFITMVGALLFLNLGTILSVNGLSSLLLSLILALVITYITALSVTSVASNIPVGRGGMYYMLSRSFGYELGAAVGAALYIAHTIAASLCILGLSASIHPFIPQIEKWILWWGILASVTLLAYASKKFTLKLQTIVFVAIAITIVLFLIGPYQGAQPLSLNHPFNHTLIPQGFWNTFALIYPALIGIESGTAMSGELKRARFSLIVGSLSATITGFGFYLSMALILWVNVPHEALVGDSQILQSLSPLGPIALVGLWAATLFSAMGCLLTAPATLTAMSADGLLPSIFKNFRLSTLVTAVLVALGLFMGSMSAIVPLLTKVILLVYGLLNLSVAIEYLIGSPSWRPSVRISPLSSIIGAALCFFVMFMMDAGEAFFACALVAFVTILVRRGKVVSKWDDLRQAILFSLSRFTIYRLLNSKKSHRYWRPNFLVLSESACLKTPLLVFADQISNRQGFITLASVLKKDHAQIDEVEKWEKVIRANLQKRKMEALVEVTIADSLIEGLKNIITNFGFRPLSPNTVVLGESVREDHFESYIKLIEVSSEAKRNVLIVRGDLFQEDLCRFEIDIWYTPSEKKSFELMIILAHLLTKSKSWRKATITLKCLVDSEVERASKSEYFEHYFDECRLSMRSEIFLKQGDDLSDINRHSTKQGLVFLAMHPPGQGFGQYYKTTMQQLKEIPTLCLVLCREEIELQKILQ